MGPADETEHEAALRELLEEARRSGESASAQKRHHLVPAFYLKQWADDGKLRVTHVDGKRSWVTTPRKAATETDYYRLESPELDPEEVPPLLFEVTLSRVERWGADFIDAAIVDPIQVLSNDEQRVLFSIFMAFQYVRGRNFRAFSHASMNDYFKLTYGEMTDAGITHFLQERGQEPTPKAIAEMRRFLDGLNSGDITVGPQKASVIGMSGQMVETIGLHLFARHWRIYRVPPILVTSDEPVVPINGPFRPRVERGSVGIAGVVIFPLTPGLLLAAFDGYKARPAVPDRLGHCDIADINREIVAACSTYAYERPGRRTAMAFRLPLTPPPTATSEPIPVVGGDGEFIIRSHRPSRWSLETHPPPWPVERWFYGSWARLPPIPNPPLMVPLPY
ncbi:DUF4238 domain-containing protein [Mycobacterium intracellulare]|nr:DUF4238 domain-containing protein [Mycobacterium intracellulare]